MINKKSNCISEIIVSKEGYLYPTEINYKELLLGEHCKGKFNLGLPESSMNRNSRFGARNHMHKTTRT